MPAPKKLESYTVSINTDTAPILEMFHRILQQNAINIPEPDDRASIASPIAAGLHAAKKGLAGQILTAAEAALDMNLGANRFLLPAQNFELDTAPEVAYDVFCNFLRTCLREEGLDSQHATSKTIYNRHVLVYVLLQRLAAHALDCDMSPDNDGLKLIKITNEFITEILTSLHLQSTSIVVRCNDGFLRHLQRNIERELSDLAAIVKDVIFIHSNQSCFSDFKAAVNRSRIKTKRQILAILAPTTNRSDYTEQWIDDKIEQLATGLVTTGQIPQLQLMETELSSLSPKQTSAIKKFKQPHIRDLLYNKATRLKALEKRIVLLNQQDEIYRIICSLEALNILIAWVTRLCDDFDLSKLIDWINDLSLKIKHELNIDETLEAVLGKSAMRILDSYQATTGIVNSIELRNIGHRVLQLTSTETKSRIMQALRIEVATLVDFNRTLPKKYQIIKSGGQLLALFGASPPPIAIPTSIMPNPRITELPPDEKASAGASRGAAAAPQSTALIVRQRQPSLLNILQSKKQMTETEFNAAISRLSADIAEWVASNHDNSFNQELSQRIQQLTKEKNRLYKAGSNEIREYSTFLLNLSKKLTHPERVDSERVIKAPPSLQILATAATTPISAIPDAALVAYKLAITNNLHRYLSTRFKINLENKTLINETVKTQLFRNTGLTNKKKELVNTLIREINAADNLDAIKGLIQQACTQNTQLEGDTHKLYAFFPRITKSHLGVMLSGFMKTLEDKSNAAAICSN